MSQKITMPSLVSLISVQKEMNRITSEALQLNVKMQELIDEKIRLSNKIYYEEDCNKLTQQSVLRNDMVFSYNGQAYQLKISDDDEKASVYTPVEIPEHILELEDKSALDTGSQNSKPE